MFDVAAQICVEQHVGGGCPGQLPFQRQPEVLGDLRAGAVGADQVPGADLVLALGQPVPQAHRHPGLILCVDRYSVLNANDAPRSAAFFTSSGSMYSWGMSSSGQGLPAI